DALPISRMNRPRLVLQPVAAFETGMLVRVQSLDRPHPRSDFLVEDGGDGGHRVEMEMLPHVGVAQPRAPEQGRSLQCAAGDNGRAGTDEGRPTLTRPRFHADGTTHTRDDALSACIGDDPGARAVRVLQPRDERRLLRAQLAAEAAVPADAVLVAAADVPRPRRTRLACRADAAERPRLRHASRV